MKLKERLKELPPDTYVYLSAGNSYFFCGTVERCNTMLSMLSKSYKAKLEDYLHTAQKRSVTYPQLMDKAQSEIRLWEEKIKQAEERLHASTRDKERFEIRGELKELRYNKKCDEARYLHLKYDVTHFPNRIAKYKHKIANFRHFPEREVKKEYPHRTKPYGTIIVIEGNEKGEFWDCEEFERVYGK